MKENLPYNNIFKDKYSKKKLPISGIFTKVYRWRSLKKCIIACNFLQTFKTTYLREKLPSKWRLLKALTDPTITDERLKSLLIISTSKRNQQLQTKVRKKTPATLIWLTIIFMLISVLKIQAWIMVELKAFDYDYLVLHSLNTSWMHVLSN